MGDIAQRILAAGSDLHERLTESLRPHKGDRVQFTMGVDVLEFSNLPQTFEDLQTVTERVPVEQGVEGVLEGALLGGLAAVKLDSGRYVVTTLKSIEKK